MRASIRQAIRSTFAGGHAWHAMRAALAVGLGHALLLGALVAPGAVMADTDLPTRFTNQGTVGNTRHNLTQRQVSGGGPTGAFMDSNRNDYDTLVSSSVSGSAQGW